MWCIPTLNEEYIARMEHLLELYGVAPNPNEPLICMDEKNKQLPTSATNFSHLVFSKNKGTFYENNGVCHTTGIQKLCLQFVE